MKKNVYIIGLLLLIYSCSSINKSIDPINAYLKNQTNANDSIVIITNKINNNYILDLWKERVYIDENPSSTKSSK